MFVPGRQTASKKSPDAAVHQQKGEWARQAGGDAGGSTCHTLGSASGPCQKRAKTGRHRVWRSGERSGLEADTYCSAQETATALTGQAPRGRRERKRRLLETEPRWQLRRQAFALHLLADQTGRSHSLPEYLSWCKTPIQFHT